MKRHILFVALCLTCVVGSGRTQTIQAFSGTWSLDLDRSTFHSPDSPVSIQMVIETNGHLLKLSRTDVMRDGSTFNFSVQVQLPARILGQQGLPFITSIKSGLQSGALVIERGVRFPNGATGGLILSCTLIEHGTTLRSEEQEIVGGRKVTDHLFFIKTAPASHAASGPDSPP